jgi:Zn-dependent protease with chaperone function
MKTFTFFIIILIVFASGFVLSKYWYSDKSIPEIIQELTKKPMEEEKEEVTTKEVPVVRESSPTTPTVIEYPEEDVIEALQVAFAQKYSKSASEVTVTMSKLEAAYASGGVRFGPETVGGGWFLAAKRDGSWKVVADGNGVVLCSLVEPYDFPTSMVPECFDEVTQTMVTF